MKKVLHLGCCNEPLPGWLPVTEWQEIRVDIDRHTKIDIAADVRSLPFSDNSCDGIFASHLLEHFDSRERHGLFKEWKRVLTLDGFIYIVVPNIASRDVIRALTDGDLDRVAYVSQGGLPIPAIQIIFGQYYPGQYEVHKWGYSPRTLARFMGEYLKNVQVIDSGLQICAKGWK